MSSLYERLQRRKREGSPACGAQAEPVPLTGEPSEWDPVATPLAELGFRPRGGLVYSWEETSPLPFLRGGETLRTEGLVYFDTETTGLSGGNAIFLAGLAWPDGDRLRIRQYFLRDFPGEAELLSLVAADLGERARLVTYNGRSFDYPMLQTRCILNRVSAPTPADHLDLLYPARRLWKRALGSCGLGDLEGAVLNVRRENDVPSFLVPAVYADFLRTGDPSVLAAVFEHNRRDILSLYQLHLTIEDLLDNPRVLSNCDEVGLGFLLFARNEEAGLDLLGRAASAGDARPLGFLRRQLRLRGLLAEYGRLCESCWRAGGDAAAGLEYAKYLEHARGLPDRALEVVETLRAGSGSTLRDDLSRRSERLLGKLARARAARDRGSRSASPRPPT